ncbi:hypothetical protein [Dactylosporangium cerinum]
MSVEEQRVDVEPPGGGLRDRADQRTGRLPDPAEQDHGVPGRTRVQEAGDPQVQPFTLPLSVVVPAGFDEARLADSLQWTVRAQTVLGPVEFRGRGNHARVTVTDGGQATPPTVWTMQAALIVGGETHLSNEVTLQVYATTV